MYGSTCADMQEEIALRIAVKITPSCCLSEKWRIINQLDDIWKLLPEVECIGKLEEGRSVTSVAAEFGIAHSIVSHDFGDFNFKLQGAAAIRGFSSGRLHEEPHPQMTSVHCLTGQKKQAADREKSLDTRHR
ncbi:hypothetical protein TNCV_2009311 [Trichonephila clavipes]|nr:hypothetical protein TNCV_2009311 [Trichonephila clavipes]